MWWLALVVGCGGEEPVVDATTPTCQHRSDVQLAADGPFAIEVRTEGPSLHADLRNLSPVVQNALVHEAVQPSRLVITDASGKERPAKDSRKDTDSALAVVAASYWERVDPCGTLPLGDVQLTKDGGTYAVAWGPYGWELPAGTYKARVDLPMRVTHYNDPRGNRRKPDGDVWTGDVTSDTVELTLP